MIASIIGGAVIGLMVSAWLWWMFLLGQEEREQQHIARIQQRQEEHKARMQTYKRS